MKRVKFSSTSFRIILPILYLTITINSYCQFNGYIITKENEFRGGLIKFTNSRSTTVDFADLETGEFKRYSSDELLEYGLHHDRRFLSKNVTIVKRGKVIAQPFFTELVVEGKINFYHLGHAGINYYFIEKEGSHLVPLNSDPEKSRETFKDALNHYMSDCEAIKSSIANSRLNRPYLETLTKRYNTCDNRIVPRFQFGIFAGVQVSSITFPKNKTSIPSLSGADFKLGLSPMLGFYSTLPLDGGLSLHAEIGYRINNYSSHVVEKAGNDVIKEDVIIKMSSGDFSLSLKYSSLKPGIRPYVHVGAGLEYAFTQSNKFERYTRTDSTETNEKFDWTKEAMSKTFLEILVGVGVSFDISGKYPLFIEARIEEMLANDPPTPFISNFGLVAGVGF